jgi:hypothetical protein
MADIHLSIDLCFSSVRFVKLKGQFIVEEKSFDFSDRQDYRYKQQLEEYWLQTGWKAEEFNEVTLSWSNSQSTLVPTNVFNETNKEEVFQLSFGKNAVGNDEVDYNRLPIQGMVNVYQIPLWVKSFFVLRFPRISIQHEGTHLIRGVFSGPTFKLKTKIIFHKDYFLLLVVKENSLKFYSHFEMNTIEDLGYFLGYTMQQLGYTDEDNEVEFTNGGGATFDPVEIEVYIQKILPKSQIINTTCMVEKLQPLCV